jgi:aminopeptidase N
MRHFATFLLFVCLINKSYSQLDLESIAKQEMKHYYNFKLNQKRNQTLPLDVHFVQLSIQPNLNNGRIISAFANHHFSSAIPISSITFDLRRELTVDSILFRGQKMNFAHTNSHQLIIPLGVTLTANQKDSIKIHYQGAPNMSSRAYFRSVTLSGPNIATLSQPYGAHYWWPCFENLKDKIDSIDIELTVDTPYIAVSNGLLISQKTVGNKQTFLFKHRYPVATYLVAIAVAKYDKYTQTAFLPSINQNLDIVNYAFPHNNLVDNKAKTLETVKMMRLFDSLFGTYPFHKELYGHAQFTWGGGMEHQTMSFMSNFNYDLIAHELAHQWFGDKVTCGSWKELWLNEGFATYLNLICYEFLESKTEWYQNLKKFGEDVMRFPNGSVYAYDTVNVNRLFEYRTTYQKGAMILHQLRWVIGDETFFNSLKEYINDSQLSYNFSRQSHLKYYLEKNSNTDLTDYFDDWVYGEGYPIYDITWVQKGEQLNIDISQMQSHSSVDLFNIDLPLLVRGNSKDSLLRIPVSEANFRASFQMPFKVKSVSFDPFFATLGKANIKFPLDKSSDFTLYPNPFKTEFFFTSDVQIIEWELTDIIGKSIIKGELSAMNTNSDLIKIDASNYTEGTYILRIKTSDNRIVNKKIIKI